MSTSPLDADVYFTKPLPWHDTVWQRLNHLQQTSHLPHALLIAGMAGLGKRVLAWQFVASLLCDASDQGMACGQCQSCVWLRAGNHPNLCALPNKNLPIKHDADTGTKKLAKSTQTVIKVDDIRNLQSFVAQQSSGWRICVIDDAEAMTVAAANALLKSLEEPAEHMLFLLISDAPAKLLPTIISRVQRINATPSFSAQTQAYLAQQLSDSSVPADAIVQCLQLTYGAPLAALNLATAKWYGLRQTWLITWRALKSGNRSVVAASEYWQKQIELTDFMQLSDIMVADLIRLWSDQSPIQQDLDWQTYADTSSVAAIESAAAFKRSINSVRMACQQNVQDNLGYAKLMQQLSDL